MDKDYLTTVFIDVNFENNGIVDSKLKPGFADSSIDEISELINKQ